MIDPLDILEIQRIEELENLDSDIDAKSIHTLLKKYVNKNLPKPVRGCNCSYSLELYFLELMNFYDNNK